jgi:hypothetical protein
LTSITTARPWRYARFIWFAASGRLGTANSLPVEKRGIFLGRLVAQLQFRGFRFTTADLDDVVRSALTGMIQDTRQLKGA